MKTTLISLYFLLFTGVVFAQLKGSYTIDPKGSGGTNYTSFTNAVKALDSQGVSGAVVFEVADGIYTERISLDSIAGTSSKHTITFQSKSLDSSKVEIKDTSFVFFLDHAPYFKFRYLTISALNPSSAYGGIGFYLTDTSHDVTIEHCVLTSNIYKLNSSYIEVPLIWGDGREMPTNLIIQNNHFIGGGSALSMGDRHAPTGSGNIIYHNQMDSQAAWVITYEDQGGFLISSNRINSYAGIIFINTTYETIVVNNFINCTYDGISADGANVKIYYNSVISNSYQADPAFIDGGDVRNNIFVNTNGGYALTDVAFSNYNDLYSTGTYLCSDQTKNYTSLSSWQKGTGHDKNSVSADPKFAFPSTGDLHLTYASSAVMNKGTPISSITTDIDGNPRNKKFPCIGASELADTLDVGISSILNPVSNTCGTSNTSVELYVHNYGLINIKGGFRVHVQVSGAFTDTVSYPVNSTLKPGRDSDMVLSFATPLSTFKGGKYIIKAWTDMTNDGGHTNDTMISAVSIYPGIKAAFNISNACLNTVAKFSDASIIDSGTINSYSWDFGNGTYATTKNPAISYSNTGAYNIKLTVVNSFGCSDIAYNSINIDSLSAAFTITHSVFSPDAKFKAIDTAYYKKYNWEFSDFTNDSGYAVSHTFTPGHYSATLKVTSYTGCTATATDTLTYYLISGIDNNAHINSEITIYPNPFQNLTNINYTLENGENVTLEVFDFTGRRIALLANEKQIAGEHTLQFIPGNYNVNSGMYLIKMQIGDRMIAKEIMMLK